MEFIKDFGKRLASRKFLAVVGGIIAVQLFPENANAIVAIVAAYEGAEGAADVVSRYNYKYKN